ncbi:MAG: substrate-binding domain-containing protein, partial [Eubacteriales bacterium]
EFAETIFGILTKIKNSSEFIHNREGIVLSTFKERLSAINKIADANAEITNGMQKQVESANVCAELSDVFQDQFETMHQYTEDLIAQADETGKISQSGENAIEQLLNSSKESQQSFLDMSDKVLQLAKSAENINGIISSVIRIGRQTNLLSINATIEAARAGLAGKGFEVVAQEFKRLAADTQKAGEDISTLIAGISAEIKSVLKLASNAQQVFESQNQSIQNSSLALSDIRDSLNDLMHKQSKVQDIVGSLFVQKKELVDSISNIVEITDQSASISQMVSSISMEQNSKNDLILDMMKLQYNETTNLKQIMSGVKTQPQPEKKLRIAFIALENEEYFNEIEESSVATGVKLNIEVLCKKPERMNVDEQIAILREFIEQKVDGIIIVPCDENRLIDPINEAVAKGIKVACVDLDVPKSKRDIYLTSDSFEGGKLSGEAAARHLKGCGKAAALICMAGIPALQERYKGFAEAIAKYPDMHIASKVDQIDSDLTKARHQLEEMLNTVDFDLLFLVNSEVGELAVDIWKSKRLDKKLIVLSTSKKITQAVGEGIVSSQI